MGWRDSIGHEDRDNPRDMVVEGIGWLLALAVIVAVVRAVLGL